MRPSFVVLGLSIASFVLFPAPTPAQSLQIEPDGSVSLFFSKPLSTVVSVEQSTDLRVWTSAAASDQILSQSANEEVIRSVVGGLSTATKMFFRLGAENGWKISLTWNRSSSNDVLGYCLHYGLMPGSYIRTIDAGDRLSAIVSLPRSTKTCYFVVTAYNALGLQSGPSPEVKARLRTSENNRSPRRKIRRRPR